MGPGTVKMKSISATGVKRKGGPGGELKSLGGRGVQVKSLEYLEVVKSIWPVGPGKRL